MKIEMKLTGIDGVLAMLQSLPAEVVSKRGGPVKSALRKGALIIRDEARQNVRKIIAEPNIGGRNDLSTGALEKAIVATRGKPPQGTKGERYLVWTGRVSRKYANTRANRRKSRVGGTYHLDPPQFYGKFLEYGTSRMRPHPWLRPAFATKAQLAIQTIQDELVSALNKVVNRLAMQNRGR